MNRPESQGGNGAQVREARLAEAGQERVDQLGEGRILAEPSPASRALERIREIADVMIGDGPGAVRAYYGPHKDGFPRGLPTSFAHLRDHARQIRRIVNDTLGDRA